MNARVRDLELPYSMFREGFTLETYIPCLVKYGDTDFEILYRFQAAQLATAKCPDPGRTGKESLPAVQQPLR